jgi:hypothetical protein
MRSNRRSRNRGFLAASVLMLVALILVTSFAAQTTARAAVNVALNPQPDPPLPVYVGGVKLTFDVDPFNANGRLLVPMRAIFEALGAVLDSYDQPTQTIRAHKGSVRIVLQVGNSTAYINDRPVPLDAPPAIIRGRTLVPLRFISEALRSGVTWDPVNRRVLIAPAAVTGRNLTLPGSLLGMFQNPPPGGFGEWSFANPADPETGKPLPGILGASLFDSYEMDKGHAKAKTVNPDYLANPPPTSLDWTPYVTLTTSQDGWGGCIARSITHCVTMLKEMEHPYSPDMSYWWLHYGFEHQRDEWTANHPGTEWPPITWMMLESDPTSEFRGLALEGSLPSDLDGAERKPYYVNGVWQKDGDGNYMYYMDFSKVPKPDQADMDQALLYKVDDWSDYITTESVGVSGLKWYLRRYGPLTSSGPLSTINPSWQTVGHCISIVGYDDAGTTTALVDGKVTTYKGVFKCLNSWGDIWANGSFFYVPYDILETQLTDFQYFVNHPSDRSGLPDAYTARLRVTNPEGRRWLKVSVGVEGHEPQVLYNTPNHMPSVCPDNSVRLTVDIPLPAYAASHWPPSQANRWYVEVKDQSDPDDFKKPQIQILGFTVAKLKRNDACRTLGRFSTDVYDAAPADVPKNVPEHQSAKLYIQGVTSELPGLYLPPLAYTLTLTEPVGDPVPGQPLLLTGSVTTFGQIGTGSTGQPIYGQSGASGLSVRLYEGDLTGCLNLPTQWKLLGGTTTGPDGAYNFSPQPAAGWRLYAVAIVSSQSEFVASTEHLLVPVGLSQAARLVLPELPIDLRTGE